QPEIKKGQDYQRLQITKEYLEQWCVQAIDADPVGAGSYPIDIIGETNNQKWGADIKALSCKINKHGELSNSESGETSLAQKFTDTGVDLDTLFKNKNYETIKNGWLDIIQKKNSKVIRDESLDSIYYFFFLRGDEIFYLCGIELDIDQLDEVEVDEENTTKDSVYLKNYIEQEYGSTKIYKAKKRLELRLRPKTWVDQDLCIELDIPQALKRVDLRKVDLDEYKKHLLSY
ncbi:hypothetical protein, partial [Cetobacterium sp.]|uniref:hypothetical protein n=1 Tax=Cetobacterium sp. TaxID=2071632 RepID=UPI003F32D485